MERPGRPARVNPTIWRAGDAFMPEGIRNLLDTPFANLFGADVNGWTLLHFLSGFVIGRFAPRRSASLIHAAWEIFQIIIGMTDTNKKSEFVDITLDTIAYEMGSKFF